jgi:hypothetical protein
MQISMPKSKTIKGKKEEERRSMTISRCSQKTVSIELCMKNHKTMPQKQGEEVSTALKVTQPAWGVRIHTQLSYS